MPYNNRRAWSEVTLASGLRVAGEIPRGSLTDDTLAYTLPPLEGQITEVQAGNYAAQPAKSGIGPLNLSMSFVSAYAGMLGGLFKDYSFEIEEILETYGEPDTPVLTVEATGMLLRAELATFTMGAQEVRGINLNYRLSVYKLQQEGNVTWDIDIPNKIFQHLGEDIFPTRPR